MRHFRKVWSMFRIHRILQHEFFCRCMALNNEREKNRPFCCHNLQHSIDVARICYILVLENNAGGEILPGAGIGQVQAVIYAAALTHDMGRWQQYDTGEDHALVGANLAKRVLEDTGFSKAEINLIANAILKHRSGSSGGGLLGQYLRQADDLSRQCWQCGAREDCKKLKQMQTTGGPLY